MNPGRDEEIAASVGARRDLGSAYDEAIAAGLVERIGAEIDRRVDERVSQHQRGSQPATGHAGNRAPADSEHRPTVHPGGQISWQQAILAFGSMVIGAITSGVSAAHANGTWPAIAVWIAIVVINVVIFRAGRRSPD